MAEPRASSFMDRLERWLLRAILIAVALLAVLLAFAAWQTRHMRAAVNSTAGGSGAAAVGTSAETPAATGISIVVDFGDGGQKRVSGIAFTPGMTVLDAMNAARSAPHGISFAANGRGETALVTQIEDVANESGVQGHTRAWQYWVNRQYGMVSVGVAALHAGDRVSWAFREYKPDPGPPPE
jgi:hypothetical protein